MSCAGLDTVAELQGLYGPFTFSEKLLQKLWLRGEFDAGQAFVNDGRPLEVIHPGRWNQLGGPDFKQARIRLGGRLLTGDIELHLRAPDWRSHGHATDPAYRDVMLHVVLFPCADVATEGYAGATLPILALLPLLHHALEDYAQDEAVERMASRAASRATEELGQLPEQARRALLVRHARDRWEAKVRYADRRLARLGWDGSCHETALEVLGYRFNRGPMLRIAAAWPRAQWIAGEAMPDQLYESERGRWSLQGVRPANQPRRRLRQYADWSLRAPAWPDRLRETLCWRTEKLKPLNPERTTAVYRHEVRLSALRETLAVEVTGGVVGGARLDTLVCNAWLPLGAAAEAGKCDGMSPSQPGSQPASHGQESESTRWFERWFHWYTGDMPDAISRTLRELALVSLEHPACHGLAQGVLGWWLAQEAAAIERAPTI